MAMKLVAFMVLAGCAAASNHNPNGSAGVDRIIKMLSEMKETLANDGKREQQIYNKYACWCETSAKRKANNIVTAQNDMRSGGQRILKLKGQVATLSAEIKETSGEIAELEERQEKATSIRQKENGAYMAETAELKESIAAMEKAVTVLSAATNKGSALLQSVQYTQCKGAVDHVLEKLPSQLSNARAANAVTAFVQATSRSTYAPQSATIQGILGDMYATFSASLESSIETESDRNAHYEDLSKDTEDNIHELQDVRFRKSTSKAEAEAMLADTVSSYDDTENALKNDMAFFDQTKAACEDKHVQYTERVAMRNNEAEGISKALEILSSDSSRALFDKAIKPGVESFLQIKSTPSLLQDGAKAAVTNAYNTLKTQVKKSHSLRLAALAVQVRTSKAGHFDKVIGSIDKMMQTLNDEGTADKDKKSQCLSEYQKSAQAKANLDWKIERNDAKISKLQSLIEQRTQERQDTIEKIQQTNAEIKQMTEEREAEHDEFQQAKKDDENAISVLEKAKAAMSEYYKDNGIDMGPIQGSVKLIDSDPEFEISEDQAPDATLSGHGSHKMESKNILSLFAYIIEDLNDEILGGRFNERESTKAFLAEKAFAESVVKDLTEKKVSLEETIATRKTDKAQEEADMASNNGELDAENGYKAKITPDCDWIVQNFSGRATARAQEMEGLESAKAFLAGQTAFLSKNINDRKLENIRFLGMH